MTHQLDICVYFCVVLCIFCSQLVYTGLKTAANLKVLSHVPCLVRSLKIFRLVQTKISGVKGATKNVLDQRTKICSRSGSTKPWFG